MKNGQLPANINGIQFQFRYDVRSGVTVRNIRFEVPDTAPNRVETETQPPLATPESTGKISVSAAKPVKFRPADLYPIGKVTAKAEGTEIHVTTTAESAPWSGFVVHAGKLPIAAGDWENGTFECEITSGRPQLPQLQIALLNSSGGRTLATSAQLPFEPHAVKTDDGTWRISIPLKKFRTTNSGDDFTSVMVQFRGSRDGIASFTLHTPGVNSNQPIPQSPQAPAAKPVKFRPADLYPIGKVTAKAEGTEIRTAATAETAPWAGFVIHAGKLPIAAEDWENGTFEFELAADRAQLPQLQITLLNSSGGRTLASSAQLPLEPYAQKIRDDAWKIAIPLKQFRTNESGSDFTSVMLQFRGSRDGIASFTLQKPAVQPKE